MDSIFDTVENDQPEFQTEGIEFNTSDDEALLGLKTPQPNGDKDRSFAAVRIALSRLHTGNDLDAFPQDAQQRWLMHFLKVVVGGRGAKGISLISSTKPYEELPKLNEFVHEADDPIDPNRVAKLKLAIINPNHVSTTRASSEILGEIDDAGYDDYFNAEVMKRQFFQGMDIPIASLTAHLDNRIAFLKFPGLPSQGRPIIVPEENVQSLGEDEIMTPTVTPGVLESGEALLNQVLAFHFQSTTYCWRWDSKTETTRAIIFLSSTNPTKQDLVEYLNLLGDFAYLPTYFGLAVAFSLAKKLTSNIIRARSEMEKLDKRLSDYSSASSPSDWHQSNDAVHESISLTNRVRDVRDLILCIENLEQLAYELREQTADYWYSKGDLRNDRLFNHMISHLTSSMTNLVATGRQICVHSKSQQSTLQMILTQMHDKANKDVAAATREFSNQFRLLREDIESQPKIRTSERQQTKRRPMLKAILISAIGVVAITMALLPLLVLVPRLNLNQNQTFWLYWISTLPILSFLAIALKLGTSFHRRLESDSQEDENGYELIEEKD